MARRHGRRDLAEISRRNGARIEETAGIAELHAAHGGKRAERAADLFRNRAPGHRLRGRVLPEVAHEATPGTFPVCQKHRRDRLPLSAFGPLLLDARHAPGGGGGAGRAGGRPPPAAGPRRRPGGGGGGPRPPPPRWFFLSVERGKV